MGKNKDLGYLGIEFQYRLVKALMEDKELFRDLNPIIDQNMFTDFNLKRFVGIMKDYYNRVSSFPSYEMMKIELNEHGGSIIDNDTNEALIEKIYNTETDGLSEITNLAIKFFRQQNIIKTANEILRIAGDGDTGKYEKCVELLNEAMRKGNSYNLGHNIFENLGDILSDDYRKPIPTGIGKLDEALNGGLGKGEFGLIAGSMGFGKTCFSTAIASFAATYKCDENFNQGYKVLQIVFEDGIKAIARKHIARLTNIEACDLSKGDNKEIVEKFINNYGDKDILEKNLRIVEFPSGEMSAKDIEEFLIKLINSGFKPDMMILDYFECLDMGESVKGENEFNKEGKVMRKFETMAKKYEITMWVTTQGTKDSVASEIMTNDKIGGSVKKTQIAHVILTIARTQEDMNKKVATIALTKNRFGPSGQVWCGVEFNNGTCHISTEHVDEYEDMTDFRKKKEDEQLQLTTAIFSKVKEQN